MDLTPTPEAALAELTSEDYLRAFSEEVGVTVSDLTTGVEGDQHVASMLWSFGTDLPAVPSVARPFLPKDVQLRWSQWWGPLSDGKATGRLEVVLMGNPSATSQGEYLLAPSGSGSTLTTTTSTRTRLPRVVAGPIEGRIDKDLVGWIVAVQARVLERRAAA